MLQVRRLTYPVCKPLRMAQQVLGRDCSTVVAARVSDQQAQLLEVVANAAGVSRSTYVREVIAAQLRADAADLLGAGELAARTAAKVRRALEDLQVS